VHVVPRLEDVADSLAPHRPHLEAAGVAAGPERCASLAGRLAAVGVHRICPIGEMQVPPLTWQQGGRPRVGDWVDWVGIETIQ